MELEGKIESLKEIYVSRIKELAKNKYSKEFLNDQILNELIDISCESKRHVLIIMDRDANIIEIIVGDKKGIKYINKKQRLKKSRAIYANYDNTSLNETLKKDLLEIVGIESIVSINIKEEKLSNIQVFYKKDDKIVDCQYDNSKEVYDDNIFSILDRNKIKDEKKYYKTKYKKERVCIIGSDNESLKELESLVQTANGKVVTIDYYRKDNISNSYFLSKGKMHNLRNNIIKNDIDTVVFDNELNKTQIKNLNESLDAKILDRTMIILDIFAKHAKTKEGKLQVLLAQLKYRQTHLIGTGKELSRLAGGIGTRGPGESKLETDRRHIRNRINKIDKELKELRKRRNRLREKRKNKDYVLATIIGYTNSGKSSLLNAICSSLAYVENKLFATLDPLTRKLSLPSSNEILVTDTVGFIRRLPHVLIEAFKSTLEEVLYADLLIIVADISDEKLIKQIEVVFEIIDEIGAKDKDAILVLNKTDLTNDYDKRVFAFKDRVKDIVFTSALEKKGLDNFVEIIDNILFSNRKIVEKVISYNELSKLSEIHENSTVIEEKFLENGIRIKAIVKERINRTE